MQEVKATGRARNIPVFWSASGLVIYWKEEDCEWNRFVLWFGDSESYEFLEFTWRVGETQISCGDCSLKKLFVWDLSAGKNDSCEYCRLHKKTESQERGRGPHILRVLEVEDPVRQLEKATRVVQRIQCWAQACLACYREIFCFSW